MQRRQFVRATTAVLVPAWAGRAGGQNAAPSCIVRPQQTEGPYFIDEGLQRSDIRSDPGSAALSPGAPLHLSFAVSRIDGSACRPLAGVLVDVWHCDALGRYSDVDGTRGQKFLRGQQLTNAQGLASFTTIYPGWYEGRAVHIHFKLRRDTREFTSQLYFDDALSDAVHRQPPYARRGNARVRNEQDGLFRRNGAQLLLPLARDGDGYAGRFSIGLQV
jgi:protocatechuate 3,4-dioxygenase beta subunit